MSTLGNAGFLSKYLICMCCATKSGRLKNQPSHNLHQGLIGTNTQASEFLDTTLILLESLLDNNSALVSENWVQSLIDCPNQFLFVPIENTICSKWSKYTQFVTRIKLFKAHDKQKTARIFNIAKIRCNLNNPRIQSSFIK